MLQGNWILIDGEQDGVAISDSELQKFRLKIAGNQHRVTWADAELEGTHEIDTAQSPMAIDATDSAGPFEGMQLQGIFQLSGDQFTVCFAAPGEPRPNEFTTQNGSAIILHRWQRQE